MPPAAEAVGLTHLGPDEISRLSKIAHERHGPLIERKAAAVAEILQAFIALGALRLRDEVDEMTAPQLALAVRAAVQALNLYQGGTQSAYTNVIVHCPGMESRDEQVSTADVAH